MTYNEILDELRQLGDPKIKSVLGRHGSPIESYGVKVGDMKPIQKRIKKDYQLSCALFDSGIPDAQYLAGLIADETQMTEADLRHWAASATWQMISEYTVAWIAAESRHGWKLALEWIDATEEAIQSSGWCTLSSILALQEESTLDIEMLRTLLQRVAQTIHEQPNRVRYTMNGYVIAAGSYVTALHRDALTAAANIGTVSVYMGKTACKVPFAPEAIAKAVERGVKRKKTVRC